jgi:uncharacterized Tic20 family protein
MMNSQVPRKFRILAAVLHAIGILSPLSLPITWILWLVVRDLDPFIDRCGRSALNFQASIILYLMIIYGMLGVMCGVLPQGNVQSLLVNFVGYPAFIISLVLVSSSFCLSIFAAVLAIRGKIYIHFLTVKFLSEVP